MLLAIFAIKSLNQRSLTVITRSLNILENSSLVEIVFMKKSNTSVTSVAENTPAMELCTITLSLLMKTGNIPAHCVIIKLERRVILHNISSLSMKT